MTNSPKEWKSYQEQIAILQSRGMIIDDEREAENCLKRIGYYRLSGYWYPFRQYDDVNKKALDTFKEGTKFSDISALYDFDRKLRLLALDAIERIELAIQVNIAYILGKRHPFAHLEPAQFHTTFITLQKNSTNIEYDEWLSDYKDLVYRARRKTFVKHNIEKYGELPIWVAIEVLDFGRLSKLFAGMKIQDKLEIEKQFGLFSGKDFQTWLRGFNFIRNTAAHHGRLWNCNVLELANVPHTKLKLSQLKNYRPFLYFCLMNSVLKVICPSTQWHNQFLELMASFPHPENNAISIHDMGAANEAGAVTDWQKWDIWR